MNSLPFSLNIFKQIEIYQNIRRLDDQFNRMFIDWKKNKNIQKNGISKELSLNYPTWEIEKKILLWTSRYHKHLGSPITFKYLKKQNFLGDMYISETEIGLANIKIVLENLIARRLASWDEEKSGVLISRQGLEWGLIISNINSIEKDINIKKGHTRYREFTLKSRRIITIGYEFLYWTGLMVVFLAMLFLGLNVYKNLNININLSFDWLEYIKYFLAIVSFLPAFLFMIGVFLIKLKQD